MLWSIHTMATKSTGEPPFFLIYRAEAVLPAEIKHQSPRVPTCDEARQDGLREEDLLLLEGVRRQAALQSSLYPRCLRHVRAPAHHVEAPCSALADSLPEGPPIHHILKLTDV